MDSPITEFQGQHRFLSNFWPCNLPLGDGLREDTIVYSTVEHFYQASKTLDEEMRSFVLRAPSAGEAKKRGQRVQLRDDWDEVQIPIMRSLLRSKFDFELNAGLHDLLILTGDAELIEGNAWGDTFWGVCRGKGENHLGKLLMEIRRELRHE